MNYKTSKGFEVAGCGPHALGYISGRVKVDPNDPSKDQMCKWDSNNNPIDHDYGQLIRATGANNTTVDGFSIFKSLIGG